MAREGGKKSKDMEQNKIQKKIYNFSSNIPFSFYDSWRRIIFPASIALVPVYYKIQI